MHFTEHSRSVDPSHTSHLSSADVSHHQSTVTTPNGPTTALHIPQMKPNPQMVNAPQTHVQSNGVHNATVEEKVVDDFLQNLVGPLFSRSDCHLSF